MIQDIQPRKYDNQYRHETPDDKSTVMFIKNGKVLARETEAGIELPGYKELKSLKQELVYLFAIDDIKFFLGAGGEPDGYEYRPMIEFRTKEPKYIAFAAAAAAQLGGWYASNRFCGRCGKEMAHDTKERMMRCESCGNMVYPKISPAVIVGVTDGDRLLMTKYTGRVYRNYALIAGFAEVGETIEETVAREVMEETGVRVKNIRYYKSQPWPFSDSLLMGFYCDLDGADTIVLDETELAVGEWMRREDIPTQADGISLTNEMIVRFKEGRV